MKKVQVRIEDRELTLSNLDKVFWPDKNVVKGELINYYREVAPYLLPHLKDRPLTMNRFPDGITGKNFYQKDCPESAPDWVTTVPVASGEKSGEKKVINYVLADQTATLVWLANLGCIEMHPWLAPYQRSEYPQVMVFDLDPNEGTGLKEVLKIAPLINEALTQFGVKGFAKTSGASGLHIYVPLEPKYTYKQVQQAAKTIAGAVARLLPDIATLERTVIKRGPRVYLDCLQNASGKTIASVYSLRPHPGAPVSFPVSWDLVEQGRVDPLEYDIYQVPRILRKEGDLFRETLTLRQNIDKILNFKTFK
jgi:bifunctional non-homologous end joining protein LigD